MKWSRSEIEHLLPILEQVSSDLATVDGKKILVLCSATGEVAFWLGEMMEQGKVTGLELDREALAVARRAAHEMGLECSGGVSGCREAAHPLARFEYGWFGE